MTHELLQPRYIVEQDYPNSPFRVGDILVVKHHPMYKDGEVFGLEDDDNVSSWITYVADFPNIFRKLNWWEYRELDEMPEYLKSKNPNLKWVDKVLMYALNSGQVWLDTGKGIGAGNWDSLYHYAPATEEEYINYLKSNEK